MADRHMERCSTYIIIREMQIKTTICYYLSLVRMAIIKKSTNKQCCVYICVCVCIIYREIIFHHRLLNIISCAIQQKLYPFYTHCCISVNLKLLIYPSSPFPFWEPKLCFLCLSLFLFCKSDHLYHFFFQISQRRDIIDICFPLTLFPQYNNLQVHAMLQTALFHSFLRLS